MKKVAIFYGGPDSESEVSISSAKNILENINREKFIVVEIFISKNLEFKIIGTDLVFNEDQIFEYLKKEKVDIVFPILHGEYGEGGALQKKLEENDVKFIGSGSAASANAMNKDKANKIFSENNILIPKSKIINIADFTHNFAYPIIVKPVNEGSSVGLFKFTNKEEYEEKIATIFSSFKEMLLQECVIGREFTCGVIDKKDLEGNVLSFALPATEVILTKTKTFDFEAKYTAGGCEEITPANVNQEMMIQIQNMAISCHKALGCKDFSRTDMIITNDEKIYVLETNTIPGMTKTSFLPAQLKAFGLGMGEFLDVLIVV